MYPWDCAQPGHGGNGYAGDPASGGLCAHYEIELSCVSEPDPAIGYVIDIKRADQAVRNVAVPRIQDAMARNARTPPERILRELGRELASALSVDAASKSACDEGRAGASIGERVRWHLSPTYRLEVSMKNEPSVTTPVLLRQKFDFAASHRLHVPSLSEEENQRLFGKCNHPSGHGHNYQIEPCVEWRGGETDAGFDLAAFERLVKRVIIDRFDHKHLNLDTREFAASGGVNPTVENIARVFFGLLAPELAAWSGQASLRAITVWETDRTSATFPA